MVDDGSGDTYDTYYDLGSYTWPVSTQDPDAQLWFDRGMAWCYGFNHDEAIACFERALEHDPGCAMAHWGIAYAIGPNYNKPWEDFDEDDLSQSIGRALASIAAADGAAAAGVTDVEQALIGALAQRFPANPGESPDESPTRVPTNCRTRTPSRPGTTPTPTPCGPSTRPTPTTSTSAPCSPRPS